MQGTFEQKARESKNEEVPTRTPQCVRGDKHPISALQSMGDLSKIKASELCAYAQEFSKHLVTADDQKIFRDALRIDINRRLEATYATLTQRQQDIIKTPGWLPHVHDHGLTREKLEERAAHAWLGTIEACCPVGEMYEFWQKLGIQPEPDDEEVEMWEDRVMDYLKGVVLVNDIFEEAEEGNED